MNKIGITEGGDASLNYQWVSKISQVDGAILITKNVSDKFIDEVVKVKDKVIVHATITGYGGTILEPNIPDIDFSVVQINKLVLKGFQKEKIVIRVDPVIPTKKGISLFKNVVELFVKQGFKRFRMSLIDMYPHVRERFKEKGLPNPYIGNNFSPSINQLKEIDSCIRELKSKYTDIRIESCAEKGLQETIQIGCISEYDLNLLGLTLVEKIDSKGFQRRDCLCYSGKTELLNHKEPCKYECLYCYWKKSKKTVDKYEEV